MTDDRTLERAARSWLDEGPTRAPDRPVDEALARIQTTPQQRDLLPRRISEMPIFARLAAAAVVVIAVAGGTYVAFQANNASFGASQSPGVAQSPDPQATVADPIADYRAARNQICLKALQEFNSADLAGFYEPSLPAEERAAVNAEHRKQTAAVETAARELASLQPPPALAAEHWKDVAREEDLAALHRLVDEIMASGNVVQGAALDPSVVRVWDLRLPFEERYNLFACP